MRHALLALRRAPLSTVTIVLTVGIAAGACLAMFATLRGVVWSPLPYQDADRLAWIYTDNPPFRFRFSIADYRALEADHPAFSQVAAYQTREVTLEDDGAPVRGNIREVTGSFFPVLGLRAAAGRLFEPADDQSGAPLAVLSHAHWLNAYGGDPAIVGRMIPVDGVRHTVVGVLEPSRGPLEQGIKVFTAARWPEPRRKGPFFTTVIGRHKPDVPADAARETLRATNARLFPVWQSSYQDRRATWNFLPLKERAIRDIGPVLTWSLAGLALVLLIAWTNAMHLLLARGLDRRREWAVRRALGGSSGQLLRPLLVECLLLATAASVLAVAVGRGLILAGHQFGTAYIPRIEEVTLSAPEWTVAAWLWAIGCVLFLMGGLLPALRAGRGPLDASLRGHRSTTEDVSARRTRGWMVTGQLALTTPLLVLATLTAISLATLASVSTGIDDERLLTARVSLSGERYASAPARVDAWAALLARVQRIPGVASAALADSRPPDGGGNLNNFDLEDRPTPPDRSQPVSVWVSASPEYFATVGLRLERGQPLDRWSLADNTIVVDRAWAQRFFPGEEVIGRRLRSGGCTECPWTTVAGVVGTVKWQGLDAPDDGAVYYPFVDWPGGYMVVRAEGDPAALSQALVAAVADVDPTLAVSELATGEAVAAAALASPRYLAVSAGLFGALALVLAAAGVLAMLLHFTRQHRGEFGIRVALGGRPADIRRLVFHQSLRLAGAGLVIGAIAAAWLAPLVSPRLYGSEGWAPYVIGGVAGILLLLALTLAIGPGREAARVNPSDLLRSS